MAVNSVFDLIVSNAYGAASFTIDFSLCNATLNSKGIDCSTPATDKDVLSYDSVSNKWKPRQVNGLTYIGALDASGGSIPSAEAAGKYYIVGVAGNIGGFFTVAVGDWVVSNGASWQKIDNSTVITSVFTRTGAVVATEGDYDLNKLGDVDLAIAPTNGKVLKYNGTKWIADDDLTGGGAGSVSTSSIANLAVTDAKINDVAASKITGTINSTQILDGTIVNADINASAAIAQSKISGLTTALTNLAITTNITEGTNLYFTNARVLGLALTGFSATNSAIVATDTILQGFNKTQGQIDSINTALTGNQWTANSSDIYRATGKVGIGTGTPGSKLHLTDALPVLLTVERNSNQNSLIEYKNTLGSMFAGLISGTNNFGIGTTNDLATGSKLVVANSGNVGVGTTTPGYKLDVQGGDINASGSVRAAGVALTSDRRWKRNITSLKNSVEKIQKTNGVSYVWAVDEYPEKLFSNKKQIGVIAQDVQVVFPELVSIDKEGFLSVNYPALIAPLIEAFKSQQAQIETNLKMFKTMQGEIEEIKINVAKNSREIASIKAENIQLKIRMDKVDKENIELKSRLAKIEKLLQKK